MLKTTAKPKGYEDQVSKVIAQITKLGYSEIKADIDEYETPPQITNTASKVSYTPDVMAKKNEQKAYFEIANKNKDTNGLINKWKALSLLAEIKNGVFQIFVPYGHMNFTMQVLNDNKIEANVIKL